jgi:hypothetical protein
MKIGVVKRSDKEIYYIGICTDRWKNARKFGGQFLRNPRLWISFPKRLKKRIRSEGHYLGDSFHCRTDNSRQDSAVCFVVVSEYRTVSAFTKHIVLLELNVLIVFR